MKHLKILIIVLSLVVLSGCSKTEQEENQTNKLKSDGKGITAIKA